MVWVGGVAGRDCIFIPGAAVRSDGSPSGTMRRRVAGAWHASLSLADPLFLVSGGSVRGGAVEADVMAELLIRLGAAEANIIREPRGRDTLDSTMRATRLLRDRGHDGVVHICTSNYHILRCRLLLSLQGSRVRSLCLPSEQRLLGWPRYLYYWVRELIALPRDLMRLAWRTRGRPEGRDGR